MQRSESGWPNTDVASIRKVKSGEKVMGLLTIHRLGRTAELQLVGADHKLDPRSVRQVCEALGLDWSKLPGPMGRV